MRDRYRAHDDRIRDGELVTRFSNWLRAVCERFTPHIDVLDLGCGTGRYFHALRDVRRLVGIDVSAPMLERALMPVDGATVAIESIQLVQGDFLQHEFEPGEFDLGLLDRRPRGAFAVRRSRRRRASARG